MDIVDYGHKLANMNWNYRKEKNPYRWQEGQKEFEKMSRLSFTSPGHRKLWLAMRKKYLDDNNG